MKNINKKGVEMPLNTIIIAAIALIVLIVVVFILTGRMNIFGTGLEDCTSKGGKGCAKDNDIANCQKTYGTGQYIFIPGTDCETKNEGKCCLKVIG